MTKYFIVWNKDKTEGFITDDKDDAKSAKTGKPIRKRGYVAITTAGKAFYGAYEGETLTIEEREL